MGKLFRLSGLLVSIIGLWAADTAPVLAEKRVALVIGNGAYRNATQLPNPANDARDVAAALGRAGFETIVGLDLDRSSMDDHTVRFARAAREADVAIFYYSGHALQFGGVNYLMPVDAKLSDEADLRRMARVDDIVADVQQAKNLRILVLDSCRDNPLAEELRRSIGRTRAASLSRGLAKIDSPQGMIIAYATQAGRTADDGAGRNSPYTASFLKHIETQEEIGTVFRRVSADVYEATKRAQLPELSLSLIGEFYLKGRTQQAALPGPAAPAARPVPGISAADAWDVVKDTRSAGAIDVFLRHHGDSVYAPLARARRDEIVKDQVRDQVALAAPVAAPATPLRKVSRTEVTRLFETFRNVMERTRLDYVEKPDEQSMYAGAIESMRNAFPAAQAVAAPGAGTRLDLNSVYQVATAIIDTRTVDQEDAPVVSAAIDGMLAALDPHSSYMSASAFREMQVQTRGEFGGVGMEVTLEKGVIRVVSPITGAPAERIGMHPADLITHIDDVSVQGLTLNQAVEKLRGKVGSTVKLRVTRQGTPHPFEISITRETIRVQAVRSRAEGDVGYIHISQFNERATDGLKQAIAELQSKIPANRVKGYVLDLRNNPGGLLDQAISVSDAFLERGQVVSTRGRTPEKTQRFNARSGDLVKGKPIVVIINGGSAAASEVVAAALQENKRATVVGGRSYGRGSVQTIIPLGGESGALRLTTARYHTPTGLSIDGKGVTPNIELKQNSADASALIPKDSKEDNVLQRALEIVRAVRR